MRYKDMKKLKAIEIDILDFVTKICDDNSLNYYLAYGTLLGAIRHKGFIPWDDDIDIVLPRKDYEKLCLLLSKKCNESSEFYFQNIHTDLNFKFPYSKVRKKNTIFLEDDEIQKGVEQGIFIDIFPLDLVKYKKGLQKVISYFVYRLLKYENKLNGFKSILANRLLNYYKEGNYYVVYGSPYKVEKDIYNIEWFGKGIFIEFEGKFYKGPEKYDLVLSQLYGDYMKLPPKNKRVSHNPKLIIFDTKFNK